MLRTTLVICLTATTTVFADDVRYQRMLRFMDEGRFAEAIVLAEEEVREAERRFGPDDPETARIIVTLGNLHASQGEAAKAGPLFVRGLAIAEKTLGPDHPSTVACRDDLAETRKAMAEGTAASTK